MRSHVPGKHHRHVPDASGPPYQDHLPPEWRAQGAEDRARLLEQAHRPTTHPPPRPGHGTVWVMPPHGAPGGDDSWSGSWQDAGNRMSDVEGSYRSVRDWVEDQPAAVKVIFIAVLDRYVDVDDDAWAQALRSADDPTWTSPTAGFPPAPCSRTMADDHQEHLPAPVAELKALIAEHGVAVRHVVAAPGEDRVDYAHTVGLTAVGHPEIVVEGLPQESAHAFLNAVADDVHRGRTCLAGTIRTDLTAEPAPVVFVGVQDTEGLDAIVEVYPDLESVQAVQLVWTDSAGRLPWHRGHANPLNQQRLRGPLSAEALALPAPAAPGGDGGIDLVTTEEGVVAVSPQVLSGAVATSAWHTSSGLWCFTTDPAQQLSMTGPLVGVDDAYLLTVDPSLADVVDLPPGVRATRGVQDRHQWVRYPEGSA